jgi:hypothetical protein
MPDLRPLLAHFLRQIGNFCSLGKFCRHFLQFRRSEFTAPRQNLPNGWLINPNGAKSNPFGVVLLSG